MPSGASGTELPRRTRRLCRFRAEAAWHYFQAREWPRAATEFAELAKRNPDDEQAWNNLGVCRYFLREWEAAAAAYTQAIDRQAEDYAIWSNRGHTLAQLHLWDRVADDLVEANRRMRGAASDADVALARLGAGQAEEYRRACAAFLARDGTTRERKTAADLYRACTVGVDAVADFRPLEELRERLGPAGLDDALDYEHAGRLLYRTSRFPEAIEQLTQAHLALGGEDRTVCLFLALAHGRLGSLSDAQKWLETAARLNQRERDESQRKAAAAPGGPTSSWQDQLEFDILWHEADALVVARHATD
jgi:tetratricopeptide (TPR) repeat protein